MKKLALLGMCLLMMGFASLKETQFFSLKDTKGEAVELKSFLQNHKAVLVNFWATWCPPCREEIPGLIDLQTKYKDKGFSVLGVDVGESSKKVESFMAKLGINYPVVLDTENAAAYAYGIVGIPTSLLINADGKIIGEYHAYTKEIVSDVAKAVE